ncbi:antitoxin [Glutamicibacter ectropisis]|uniref:Antitoxin n=1 Tax=Glutamicibacter ectropisis TaxID=3046593 RepID=A0AAU6WC13_9MICC
MAGFDDLRGKAEEFAKENPEQVSQGIDQVGDFIDDKTGGKFAEQVDGVQQGANDFVKGLGGNEQGGEGENNEG